MRRVVLGLSSILGIVGCTVPDAKPDDRAPVQTNVAPPALFQPAGGAINLSTDLANDKATLRQRAVTVDLSLFEPGQSAMQDVTFFDDASFRVIWQERMTNSSGGVSARGIVAGFPESLVTMATRGDAVAMQLRTQNGRRFELHALAGGIHIAREIDPEVPAACGLDAIPAEQEKNTEAGLRVDATQEAQATSCTEVGHVFDLLVLYTPRAVEDAGSTEAAEAAIELAVARTNVAYANSHITTRVRLAHMQQTNYVEAFADPGYPFTPGMLKDLNHLTNTDGFIDEAFVLRNQYRADIVTLITRARNDYCGIGWMVTNQGGYYGNNVSSIHCLWSDTLAHEIGHNMGSMHDRANSPYPGAYPYSYGHRFGGGNFFGTVMAYASRLPYFSNPDVTFHGFSTGVPVGQAGEANNALSINNRTGIFENWAASDCNHNGVCDASELTPQNDCGGNGVPDECEYDCNQNGVADSCDLFTGTSEDCEQNGIPDECELVLDCNGNGVHDNCELARHEVGDCNQDGTPDQCDPDCNGNNESDLCELFFDKLPDVQMNGVPDDCEPPIVTANGPRSLEVRPLPSPPGSYVMPYALKVTSLDLPCMEKYVGPGGTLRDTPYYSQWEEILLNDGVISVRGAQIIPNKRYDVRMILQWPAGLVTTPPGSTTTWTWADVNHDGLVNVVDVGAATSAMNGTGSVPAADVSPCTPDGVVNQQDISWVTGSMQDYPFLSYCNALCMPSGAGSGD